MSLISSSIGTATSAWVGWESSKRRLRAACLPPDQWQTLAGAVSCVRVSVIPTSEARQRVVASTARAAQHRGGSRQRARLATRWRAVRTWDLLEIRPVDTERSTPRGMPPLHEGPTPIPGPPRMRGGQSPCYVTSKSEHICNSKPEHSSRVGRDSAAGMLDGDLVAEQAHPDVLAHEFGGHSIVLSPQGDGGVAAHQAADHRRQNGMPEMKGRRPSDECRR